MSCRVMLFSAGGILAVAMALSPVLAAPGLKTDGKPEANASASEAIRKALDTPNNFEFKEQNLSAIIATISEQYKIQIVLDRATVSMMGIAPEEMNVDLNMKNTKLRTALRALVGQYNLTFAITDGHLLITTEEMVIQRQFKQRIDVSYDNVPLQTAMKELSAKHGVSVVFESERGVLSFGNTDADGRYTLSYIRSAKGAGLGKNIVRISTPTMGPTSPLHKDSIPAIYNTQSTLAADVVKGRNVFNFALESKPTAK